MYHNSENIQKSNENPEETVNQDSVNELMEIRLSNDNMEKLFNDFTHKKNSEIKDGIKNNYIEETVAETKFKTRFLNDDNDNVMSDRKSVDTFIKYIKYIELILISEKTQENICNIFFYLGRIIESVPNNYHAIIERIKIEGLNHNWDEIERQLTFLKQDLNII
jgi:hypothetical protein